MFGYVNIFKDELKIKDYDTYRAYYCGLCKVLGKMHNQAVRMSLNYDLTFLALMIDSLSDAPCDFVTDGCIKKIGKRKIINSCTPLEFASDMNVVLTYYKLKDDIADSHSLKAMLAIIPFLASASRIRKKYPGLCKVISDSLLRLSFLEEMNCDVIDKAAHEFATIMQAIFKAGHITLGDFGYQLGRLIYIMDAYDDMHDDYIAKRYNPAVLQYSYTGELTSQIKKKISDNLYYSLAEVAALYKGITINKNKAITDNIIFLGLRAGCDKIINQCKQRKENK